MSQQDEKFRSGLAEVEKLLDSVTEQSPGEQPNEGDARAEPGPAINRANTIVIGTQNIHRK